MQSEYEPSLAPPAQICYQSAKHQSGFRDMDPSPEVSVIMAVRNGARWLSEAIDSLLAQTLTNIEILIIDDGSVDETPTLLANYAGRDRRIRVLQQEPLGLVPALNRGLREAVGEFVARLDADDVAAPRRLERQVRYLREHQEVSLLGSWADRIDDSGRSTGRFRPVLRHEELVKVLAKTNPFAHSSVMLRAKTARDVDGYRTAFEGAEDYDLWLRISERARIASIPEPLLRYRWHDSNVTQRKLVRQSFSVRLAKHAARIRQATGYDPACELSAPPDWRSDAPRDAFYAQDVKLFRFLELADRDVAESLDLRLVAAEELAGQISGLSHSERKLAQQALINFMNRRDAPLPSNYLKLLLLLVRLHPTRAVDLLWGNLVSKSLC